MSNPPAGWYPDPSGAPGQRYWDGQSWTAAAVAVLDATPMASAGPGELSAGSWSNLEVFIAEYKNSVLSGTDPEGIPPILKGLIERLELMYADPAIDTSCDGPLLVALASAIVELEQKHLLHLLKLTADIQHLQSYALDLEKRLIESGLPIARPDQVRLEGLRTVYIP